MSDEITMIMIVASFSFFLFHKISLQEFIIEHVTGFQNSRSRVFFSLSPFSSRGVLSIFSSFCPCSSDR
jgi:hypothetical protein